MCLLADVCFPDDSSVDKAHGSKVERFDITDGDNLYVPLPLWLILVVCELWEQCVQDCTVYRHSKYMDTTQFTSTFSTDTNSAYRSANQDHPNSRAM